ncbi:MAG: cupin domain-containing protein [Myxococcales bacterium]|nr:cupin domain-containing protein [Myxococcales bacterium]MCB9751890.1 cupin domain-containing protein [Myxococcales bacterium]
MRDDQRDRGIWSGGWVERLRGRAGLLGAFLLGACFTASGPSVAGGGDASEPADTKIKPAPPAESVAAGLLHDAKPPEGPPLEPTVQGLDAAPHRQAPNGKADIWMLARGHNAFIGKLELAAGGAVPEHRDPTEEYLHVLEGSGTLHIDDVEHAIGPGTTIFMPANAKVRYQNGDARLVALQVFAGPGPAAKYDGWRAVAE